MNATKLIIAALLPVACLGVLTEQAWAGSLDTSPVDGGDAITFTAGAGETNSLELTPSADGLTFTIDDVHPIDISQSDCASPADDTIAICSTQIVSFNAILGDGNDAVFGGNANVPLVLLGQGGDDIMIGGSKDDIFRGGEGDDTGAGGAGADDLRDGDANDPGTGSDTVTYEDHAGGVFVDLDSTGDRGDGTLNPATGLSDEGDIVDFTTETVIGSKGKDVMIDLVGNMEEFRGLEGNDVLVALDSGVLTGGPGDDDMGAGRHASAIVNYSDPFHAGGVRAFIGQAGNGLRLGGENDSIRTQIAGIKGSAGPDVIVGGSENDFLSGEGGVDAITGGLGTDIVAGGAAGDFINTRDGVPDEVSCDDNDFEEPFTNDQVLGDLKDKFLNASCNQVDIAAVDQGYGLRVRTKKVKFDKRGVAKVKVACPVSPVKRCAGKLVLSRIDKVAGQRPTRTVISSARFKLKQKKRATLKFKIGARKQKAIRKRGVGRGELRSVEPDVKARPKTTATLVDVSAAKRAKAKKKKRRRR